LTVGCLAAICILASSVRRSIVELLDSWIAEVDVSI
jgi:hypothetical protein